MKDNRKGNNLIFMQTNSLAVMKLDEFWTNQIPWSRRCIMLRSKTEEWQKYTHESEQILIATTTSPDSDASYLGEGFVTLIQKEVGTRGDDPKYAIKTIFLNNIGDTVCIPPNVLHCHGSRSKEQDFSHIAIRRTTVDNGQQAKSLWEYDINAMKKIMGILDDDGKIVSILNELQNEIETIISEAWNAV